MMNLHLDEDAFKVLINTISTKTGYRADVLEKDYYVVLVLEELSQNQKAGLEKCNYLIVYLITKIIHLE